MGKVSYRFYNRGQAEEILPQMFAILATNMGQIAPTGNRYEEDRRVWLSYMAAAQDTQILLMYVGETLAGYFQYRIEGATLLIDEIEIAPAYQRTLLFYGFFKFMAGILPGDVAYAQANIHKQNTNSQRIAAKLGLKVVGENKNGRSGLYRGEIASFKKYLPKTEQKNRS